MAEDEVIPAFALPQPSVLVPENAQVSSDQTNLQHQRQAELQAAADRYAHDQKLTEVARRRWINQREQAHLNLMAQVPKIIGAVVVGAVVAYLVPMGRDR